MKPSLYIASPLFNDSELSYNEKLCDLLEPYFNVYLPQRDGKLMDNLIKNGMQINSAKEIIFCNDIAALLSSDYLLINLNGRSIDEGAVFELGFAYANKKKCIGIQTDIRRLLPYGNNPMIDSSLAELFSNEKELIMWIKEEIEKPQFKRTDKYEVTNNVF